MKIGLIQTNPQDDFKKNITKIKSFILDAVQKDVKLIVLPETFTFMGNNEDRKKCAKKNSKKAFNILQEFSQKYNIYIVGGSMDEVDTSPQPNTADKNNDKLYNTCFTFAPSGHVISEYRKLHLFNLFDAEGKPSYCESDIYKPGFMPSIYPINLEKVHWQAINIICYDIRFPEIIRHPGEAFDILFVPAAFTWATGNDHWETLLRARAIENQCYVVACNQTGYFFNEQKRNYGNSMVIGPWGNVIARLGEEEGLLITDISKSEIKNSRARIPTLNDRKIF